MFGARNLNKLRSGERQKKTHRKSQCCSWEWCAVFAGVLKIKINLRTVRENEVKKRTRKSNIEKVVLWLFQRRQSAPKSFFLWPRIVVCYFVCCCCCCGLDTSCNRWSSTKVYAHSLHRYHIVVSEWHTHTRPFNEIWSVRRPFQHYINFLSFIEVRQKWNEKIYIRIWRSGARVTSNWKFNIFFCSQMRIQLKSRALTEKWAR